MYPSYKASVLTLDQDFISGGSDGNISPDHQVIGSCFKALKEVRKRGMDSVLGVCRFHLVCVWSPKSCTTPTNGNLTIVYILFWRLLWNLLQMLESGKNSRTWQGHLRSWYTLLGISTLLQARRTHNCDLVSNAPLLFWWDPYSFFNYGSSKLVYHIVEAK